MRRRLICSCPGRIPCASAARTAPSSAKLARPSGDAYVFLHIMDDSASNHHTLAYEQVVEVQPMQTGQVLDAGALQKGLAGSGRVALYGIYFDIDQAQIKPESKAQLDARAQLLNSSPSFKVYIVGRTDNQDQFAAGKNEFQYITRFLRCELPG